MPRPVFRLSGARPWLVIALCAPWLWSISAAAQASSAAPPWKPWHPDFRHWFRREAVYIPMRDGVRLYTEIYIPINRPGPFPILLNRTPYGVTDNRQGFCRSLRLYRALARDGYIFAFQDIRGRFRSGGHFIMNRPPRAAGERTDESTDAYDTIQWLVRHVPGNNERAGIFGISYGGWLSAMALLDPPPALKAVSEQASPGDMFLGDDFHHNGAFRLSYGFEYAAMMETNKTNFHFRFNRYDTFEWYWRLGPLANVNRLFLHGSLPSWNHFVEHPNYDAFWKTQAIWRYLQRLPRVPVPTLNVAGWWDQEDFYGPQKIYSTLERLPGHNRNFLVVGPWNHGGWAAGPGDHLGPVRFHSSTGAYFRERIEAPWFAYWLKGRGRLPFPKAAAFETGLNRWRRYSAWPPRRSRVRRLYLRAGMRLSFSPPAAASAFDRYLSNPQTPVPYYPRPIRPTYPGPKWPVWLVRDQRFANLRPDVLSWETPALSHPLAIAGDIRAHLFASTSGSDSDWVVKLIDVYPQRLPAHPAMGGYELMIADEIFRGRFLHSFRHPQPLVPGRINRFVIDLHGNDHVFLPGHRIMVQVQSTLFPLYDRNPQKFVPNIFLARPQDFITARQKIWRSRRHASYIELPVAAQ